MPDSNYCDQSTTIVESAPPIVIAPPPTTVLRNFFFGATGAVIVVAAWWLLAEFGLARPPTTAAALDIVTPLFRDLSVFAGYNFSHNLTYILLLAGLVVWFEIVFRRRVAGGHSTAPVVGQFKRLSLLNGILSMAISLPGVLENALASGGDAKTSVGAIYFKFGLFVLGAVIFEVRHAVFEHHAGNLRRDEVVS